MRWAARERAPSPDAADAGEGWDGGLSRESKGIVAQVARAVPPVLGSPTPLAHAPLLV